VLLPNVQNLTLIKGSGNAIQQYGGFPNTLEIKRDIKSGNSYLILGNGNNAGKQKHCWNLAEEMTLNLFSKILRLQE